MYPDIRKIPELLLVDSEHKKLRKYTRLTGTKNIRDRNFPIGGSFAFGFARRQNKPFQVIEEREMVTTPSTHCLTAHHSMFAQIK